MERRLEELERLPYRRGAWREGRSAGSRELERRLEEWKSWKIWLSWRAGAPVGVNGAGGEDLSGAWPAVYGLGCGFILVRAGLGDAMRCDAMQGKAMEFSR